MSRRKARITQAEIQRAIRAAKKEGLPMVKLYLPDQTAAVVIPLTGEKPEIISDDDEEIIL